MESQLSHPQLDGARHDDRRMANGTRVAVHNAGFGVRPPGDRRFAPLALLYLDRAPLYAWYGDRLGQSMAFATT